MDIYYDNNLDWVSTQVKYFPFLRIVTIQVQIPTIRHANPLWHWGWKPVGTWEVKVHRITGFSYGNSRGGQQWHVHGQSKIKARSQLYFLNTPTSPLTASFCLGPFLLMWRRKSVSRSRWAMSQQQSTAAVSPLCRETPWSPAAEPDRRRSTLPALLVLQAQVGEDPGVPLTAHGSAEPAPGCTMVRVRRSTDLCWSTKLKDRDPLG